MKTAQQGIETYDDFPLPFGDGESKAEQVLWCTKAGTVQFGRNRKFPIRLVRFYTFADWLQRMQECVRKGFILSIPEPAQTTLGKSLETAHAKGYKTVEILDGQGHVLASYQALQESI